MALTFAIGALFILGGARRFGPEAARPALVCQASAQREAPAGDRLLRSEGVSAFTTSNTAGAVLTDRVRALAIDPRGLWLGYQNPGGIAVYDRSRWADCSQAWLTLGQGVNSITADPSGRIWVATERDGVAMLDDAGWHAFTTADGLPSLQTFAVVVDARHDVWVATWEGIARFDGRAWITLYSVQNNTLGNNHVHSLAFDGRGGIWAGHVADGLSHFEPAERRWTTLRAGQGNIAGDQVRALLVAPEGNGAEAIWVATADGGVSRYRDGTWTTFGVADGLPSASANALAIDRYARVWAATSKGVAYYDGATWWPYTRLETLALAIGTECPGCPFDDDHVWTGTVGAGVTHSRLPLPDQAVDVVRVSAPTVVAPGDEFSPEVTVVPRPGYQLRQDRGDFLSHIDDDDARRFGAWQLVPVIGTISAGQPFTFTDRDNPFRAPALPDGVREATFTSRWRVWMYTRYVGPEIHITFTVRAP